jgi:hypothetical protein
LFGAGTYSRRFALASGRFAMVDDGLGSKLVPWTPSIEKHMGAAYLGRARRRGGGWGCEGWGGRLAAGVVVPQGLILNSMPA